MQVLLVVPSVDIRRGRCVQLRGGRLAEEKIYGDPIEWAERWVGEGAPLLHVVDLDAAMGNGDNLEVILKLLDEVDVEVQVGGGVRSLDRAEELVKGGASRVIVGTLAVKNPDLVREFVEVLGGKRVMVAVDARSGKVVIEGWREQTGRSVVEMAKEFEGVGVGYLLFTDVDVEGSMGGLGRERIRELVASVHIPVFASGGVGSLRDIRVAKATGIAGLVVGTALYEGKFTLKQAMEVIRCG